MNSWVVGSSKLLFAIQSFDIQFHSNIVAAKIMTFSCVVFSQLKVLLICYVFCLAKQETKKTVKRGNIESVIGQPKWLGSFGLALQILT